MRITQEKFDGGLALSQPKESIPEGTMRRNKGLYPFLKNSVRSRNGSSLISSLDAHTIFYFDNTWYYGVGTSFYRDTIIVKTGLSGDKLSCISAPPIAGLDDQLFVVGGEDVFKIASDGTITNWGIEAPASIPTATADSSFYTQIVNGTHKWTASVTNPDEYYCELAAGGDPSFSQAITFRYTDVVGFLRIFPSGLVGNLEEYEFAWGDNDSLGYDTIYTRWPALVDPNVLLALATVMEFTDDTDSLLGEYKYKITYKNSTTGSRSNAGGEVVISDLSYEYVDLAAIPDGSLVDSQVDIIEIWRTEADATVFFYLDEVATGTTTYEDDGSVTLSSTELPTDNNLPFDYFDTGIYFNASMFWITRSQGGQRGRLFYSPVGRCESNSGFINVSVDTDGLQNIFIWQGLLHAISKKGIFRVQGTNPYAAKQIGGCLGTSSWDTVVVTPYGVLYEATDGIHIFDGSRSPLVTPYTIERLFRGSSIENLTSFTGTNAGYARDEYFISDETQTLALHMSASEEWFWREIGKGIKCLHWNENSDILAANIGGNILNFEKEGANDDNGTSIDIEWSPRTILLTAEQKLLLRQLIIDANTSDELIEITLVLDDVEIDLGTFKTSERKITSINIGKHARSVGIILTASIDAQVEVFKITYDFYNPEE